MARKAISREDPIVQIFFPCDIGTRLLEEFAAARPEDYTFLEPKDFSESEEFGFCWHPRVGRFCGPRTTMHPLR